MEEQNPYPGSLAGSRRKQDHSLLHELKEPLYDEHLYRDSFLEERKEERSQALLITLALLLLIVLLAGAFLTVYYLLRQRSAQGGLPGAAGHTAGLESEFQNEAGLLLTGTETADVITVVFEDDTEDGGPGEGKVPGAETTVSSAAGTAAGKETETETGTAAEKETETEKGTETAAERETEPETRTALKNIDTRQIEQIAEDQSDAKRWGVYVCDLKTGEDCVAGAGDEPMYATAVISVPILYTAAVLLDEGSVRMEDELVYVNSIGGRGEAYPEQRDGRMFPLSYYLTTMLTYSDNNCMNVLIDAFGSEVINESCRRNGYRSVDLQRKIVDEVTGGKENYVSASDLGGMVRDLYAGKFASIGKDFMEQYFRISELDEGHTVIGLAEGLNGAQILGQDGLGDTRFAEVAVVTNDRCAYVISAMMDGESGFGYLEAVQEISEFVFRSMEKTQETE